MCCRADTCNVLCPFDFMYPFPVRFCHQSHATRLVAIPCMRRQISKTLPCLQPKSGGTDHVRTTVCILRQSNDAYTIVDRSYLISYMHVQVYAGVAGHPKLLREYVSTTSSYAIATQYQILAARLGFSAQELPPCFNVPSTLADVILRRKSHPSLPSLFLMAGLNRRWDIRS